MNNIPDATTITFFRERLRKAEVIEDLFKLFETYLRSQGLQARGGQIIDATLVPVPKQRNSRDENKEIKAGKLPEGWDENPDRLRQKGLDARWMKKNGINHYGYKNSICIDVDHGFNSYADMLSLLPISTTARCFHFCLIQKTSMMMSGLTPPIQCSILRIS